MASRDSVKIALMMVGIGVLILLGAASVTMVGLLLVESISPVFALLMFAVGEMCVAAVGIYSFMTAFRVTMGSRVESHVHPHANNPRIQNVVPRD